MANEVDATRTGDSRTAARQNSPRTARVRAFTVLLAVGAVGLASLLDPGRDRVLTGLIGFAILTALFAAAESMLLHLHIGESGYTFSTAEAVVVLALFHSSPAAAISAHVVGGLVVLLLRRQAFSKMLFNLSNIALANVAAWLTCQHILSALNRSQSSEVSWLAAFASVAVFSILTVACVFFVVSLSQEHFNLREFGRDLGVAGLNTVGTGAIGIVAATLLRTSANTAVLLLVPVTGSFFINRTYLNARRRSEQLTFIHASSESFETKAEYANQTTTDSLVHILEAAREQFLLKVVEFEYCVDEQVTRIRVTHGQEPTIDSMASAALIQAAPQRSMIADHRDAALSKALRFRGFESAVVAPVVIEGKVEGVLTIAEPIAHHDRLGADHVEKAALLARNLSVTLGKGKLEQSVASLRGLEVELSKQLRRDPLTGLLNRVGFDEYLQEFDLVSRSGDAAHVSLVFVDLNNFKNVNDTFGHQSGDMLLTAVGQKFAEIRQDGEIAARLGGDEFGFVLTHPSGTDLAVIERQALERAEQLAEAIEVPVAMRCGTVLSPRASVGVATVRPNETIRAALERADAAMYRAKRAHKRRETDNPSTTSRSGE